MCAALCCWAVGLGKVKCWARSFHGVLLQRGVSAERLASCTPMPCLWCAHRARTAKRLWHTPMAGPVLLHWRGAFGEWMPKGTPLTVLGQGKDKCRARSFHGALLQRGVFAERLACYEPMLCLWCAHRARTAKRLWHTPMAGPVLLHWRGAFREWMPKGNPLARHWLRAPATGPSPKARH